MNHRVSVGWVFSASLLLALGAAGCSDDDPADTGAGGGTTSSTGTTSTAGSGGAGGTATSGTGGGGTGGDAAGGGGEGGTAPDAMATSTLAAKSGSNASGTAVFTLVGDEVTLVVQVAGVTPAGKHGFHIHEVGDCSAADGTSAGGHWDPEGHDHGQLGTGHLGDIGNIEVDADGNGTLTLKTDLWTIGGGEDHDVVGHALILHEKEDNQQANANPGARIACGVILQSVN